jgi:hypothetical protein
MGRRLRKKKNAVIQPHSYREEFDSKLEWLIRSWLMNKRNFESLDFKLKVALVNEFYHREDFPEILIRNRSLGISIVSSCFRFQRKLILSCSTVGEMTLVLRNIFLSCRMLPLDQQRAMCRDLDKLLRLITKTAKEDALVFHGSFDQLISNLLNFEALPLTYDESAKTVTQHHFIFSKIIWNLIPLIVESTQNFVNNPRDTYGISITKIWSILKQPRLTSENWEVIVSRMIKCTKWNFLSFFTGNSFKLISESIHGYSDSSKDLCLFINVLVALKLEDQETSKNLFQSIIESYRNQTEYCKRTQFLLTSLLLSLPKKIWKSSHIFFARQIRDISGIRGEPINVLLSVYEGVADSEYILVKENFVDIIEGLKDDYNSWMLVLLKFQSNRRLCYDEFYVPLKSFMSSFVETNTTSSSQFSDLCAIFAEVLSFKKSASREDWELILNILSCYDFDFGVLAKLILEIPVLNLTETHMRSFTDAFLFQTFTKPSGELALLKIAEITKEPEQLAVTALETLNNSGWNEYAKNLDALQFIYFLAQRTQTVQVYEQSLIYLSRVVYRWLATFIEYSLDSNSMLLLTTLITRTHLCSSPIYVETCDLIFDQIEKGFSNLSFHAEDRFNLVLVLYELNPSRVLQSKSLNQRDSWSIQMAHLCFSHRTNLNPIDMKDFKDITTAIISRCRWVDFSESSYKTKLISQVLCLIQEFHEEPYFSQLISLTRQEILNLDDFAATCLLPRLLLADNLGKSATTETRKFLLNISAWYELPIRFSDNDKLAYHLLLREVNKGIAKSIAKEFCGGVFDENLLVFASSLYFIRLEQQAELIEIFSVSILVQIAK